MDLLSAPGDRTTTGSGWPAVPALVRDVSVVNGRWSAELTVDPADPYLFDQPLDHVPPAAVLGGLLDLLRASGVADPEDAGLEMVVSVEFVACGEFEPPLRLHLVRAPVACPGMDGLSGVAVRAEQDKRMICAGTIGFRPAGKFPPPDPLRIPDPSLIGVPTPVETSAVDRRRPENVLVTDLSTSPGVRLARVAAPPPGHRLAGAPDEPLRAELLIDAACQFATLIDRTEHALPADLRRVLFTVHAEFPCGPRPDVHLRWILAPPCQGRCQLEVELLTDGPAAPPQGRVKLSYHTVDEAGHQRLRTAARNAF